jgi:hypothetical protein
MLNIVYYNTHKVIIKYKWQREQFLNGKNEEKVTKSCWVQFTRPNRYECVLKMIREY